MTRIAEMLNMAYHGCKEREKPELFQDVRKWLAEMDDAPDAATRMRDRCVQKVRKVLRPYELEFRQKTDGRFATNMVDYAVMELESLTLEQGEQEK